MPRDRPTRGEFVHFKTFTTRWRENDAHAHMNNAVFYEYVDRLVNGGLIRSGGLEALALQAIGPSPAPLSGG